MSKVDNALKSAWERLKAVGQEVETQVYARLGTARRLLIVKNKEGQTVLDAPLFWAALVGLLLLVWAAPLLVIAVVGALLFKYEFVVVKEGPQEPR